jgi:predicted nuclease of predicted toxin-antitoxin system
MKIRFQADNDFNKRIIDALLRLAPQIDFKTAPERGLHHVTPDEEVLRLAAEEGRILVSHDFKTMP